MAFIYVFLGGGLGSVVRYIISKSLKPYQFTFPWATFLANIFACILLGMLIAYVNKNNVSEAFKYTFIVGFCGGFSTFSTFSNDTFELFEQGNLFLAFLNIIMSIVLCLFCIYLGMKLIK